MPEYSNLYVLGLAGALLLGVPLYALSVRGRMYASFATVILLISLPGALVLRADLLAALPDRADRIFDGIFAVLLISTGFQLAHLVRAKLRGLGFRLAISIPGQVFIAGGALTGAWLLVLLPVRLGLWWFELGGGDSLLLFIELLPFAIAVASVSTSMRLRPEVVRVSLGAAGGYPCARYVRG